jgi:hypothetical protein
MRDEWDAGHVGGEFGRGYRSSEIRSTNVRYETFRSNAAITRLFGFGCVNGAPQLG